MVQNSKVENIAGALVIQGIFGELEDSQNVFGMVIANDVSFASLSQVISLITPNDYPELAEALRLDQYDVTFLPGQWWSQSQNACYFRPLSPEGGTFLVVAPLETLTEDSRARILEYIEQYSSAKGDGPKYIQTNQKILFPIVADVAIAKIQTNMFAGLDGLGLAKPSSFGEWGEDIPLTQACMLRWNSYCPGLEFTDKMVNPRNKTVPFPQPAVVDVEAAEAQ